MSLSSEQKELIKQISQGGFLLLLDEIALEVNMEQDLPSFQGNAEKLVYETGRLQGIRDGLSIFSEKIRFYSK